jgi:ubiquinone/menaquinone biosynthesis C-methylase UbiE
MLTVDFDYFDLQPGHVCVDLGCGEGRHSLTAYLQQDVAVIGLDLSHQDLKTAQSRIADMATYNPKGSVDFAQADGLSLPLADQSVDRLICSEVLEHIPNYIGFLEEIDRVLKPDGTIVY